MSMCSAITFSGSLLATSLRLHEASAKKSNFRAIQGVVMKQIYRMTRRNNDSIGVERLSYVPFSALYLNTMTKIASMSTMALLRTMGNASIRIP